MTALTKIENMPLEITQDQVDLLKNTVCKGASNDELQLFLHVCRKTGLDPLMKQIYSIPRGGQRTIQTSIDGLRLIAERTKKYAPGKEPVYNYDDKSNLISATSFVKKMTCDGTWHEVAATSMFCEYNPGNNTFWKKMPHVMLAKCAEAAALRKAFPNEMSGIYAEEEMEQSIKRKDEEENKEIELQVIKDENLSQEKIEDYLNLWGEKKENFRIFMKSIMNSQKWNEKKAIETFEKKAKYTEGAFQKWMNSKEKNS
jgi:phage recombination protein Bet